MAQQGGQTGQAPAEASAQLQVLEQEPGDERGPDLNQQLTARGWRDAEPSNLDVSAEKPRLIAKMAEVAYGSTAATKIASAMHLSTAAVQDVLSHFAKREDFTDESIGLNGKIVKFPTKHSH